MLFVAALQVVQAAGPGWLTPAGKPYAWMTNMTYNCDLNPLGDRSNITATQLTEWAFNEIDFEVQPVFRITRGSDMPTPVTTSNIRSYYGKKDGRTPIVYDSDGSITDLLLGADSKLHVAGFAAPDVVDAETGEIIEGISVMNGAILGKAPLLDVQTTLAHEFMHMVGCAHSQLNRELFNNGDPNDDRFIPLMYPFLRDRDGYSTPWPGLHFDDRLSLNYLYPKTNFFAGFGHATGRVYLDTAEFRGANVILRDTSNPSATSVAWPSGMATRNNAVWEAHMLPDGSYTCEIEQIDSLFIGGSRIGQFDPPPTGVTKEYYNGPPTGTGGGFGDESGDPFTDDSRAATQFTVTQGNTATNVNLKLQQQYIALSPASGTLSGRLFASAATLPDGQYVFRANFQTMTLTLNLAPEPGKTIDVYIRGGAPVGSTRAGFTHTYAFTNIATPQTLVLNKDSTPPVTGYDYYIALVARNDPPTAFTLSAATTEVTVGDPANARKPPQSQASCRAAPVDAGSAGTDIAPVLFLFGVFTVWRRSRRRCAVPAGR
ncbi:MAG: hypothetical protein HY815_11150 [Candidatus Riflebacteria bacterium]|nr:hypothetical protein [Candidatus Riflebacteria bacterium]